MLDIIASFGIRDYIALGIIAAAAAAAGYYMKRRGKKSCCGGCAGCALAEECHKKDGNENGTEN